MTNSYEAVGARAEGSTSLSIALPSGGYTLGKLIVVKVTTKPGATAVVGTPTGWGDSFFTNNQWNRVAESTGTFGTDGADTGPTKVVVFWKIATGAETGNLTVGITNGNSSTGQAMRFSTNTGAVEVQALTGQDSSSGTGYSAACSTYAGWAAAGDMLVALTAGPSDAVTWASQSITATGLTIGSATEIAEQTSTIGNDIGGATWYATVTSGTMSGTAVNAVATLSSGTNAYGPAVILRIRDSWPTGAPNLVGTPVGQGRSSAGTLTIAPQTGAAVWYAEAIGDFSTLTNVPTSPGWRLIGVSMLPDGTFTNRAFYLAETATPSSTWTITTGLATIMVRGYDRAVQMDFNLAENSIIGPTYYAERECLVTRTVSLITGGPASPTYPTGHALGQAIATFDISGSGAAYNSVVVASKTVSVAGSVGAATWTFGSPVLGTADSVPPPQAITMVAYTSPPPYAPVSPGSGIVWQDEFTSGTLDTSKWTPAYTAPRKFNGGEEQAYTPRTANIELTGTELRLHLLRETFAADGISAAWTSGRLKSVPVFRNGEIRARIWVPAGQGLWPAAWLLGFERTGIGGWPGIGEADFLETYNAATTLKSAVHGYDPSLSSPPFEWFTEDTENSVNLSSGWHEFYVQVSTTQLVFGYNAGGGDITLWTKTRASLTGSQVWPFDNPQHIVLNLATGSSWGGATDGSTPNDNVMRVDWVRVSDAEVYSSTAAIPEGGFAGSYAWGAAVAGGARDSDGGFAGSYAWGAAVADGRRDSDGGFEGAYGWGPAAFDGSGPSGGGFSGSYAWGPGTADGETDYAGGFAGTYGWGPGVAGGPSILPGGVTMSNQDLERAYLGTQGATGPSIADAREQVYVPTEWEYFSALSGLTPAAKFSLADHKLAYYKAQTGDSGSIADTSRSFWG